jgi:glycosyltransferase involved in cell wall biosynthesis
MSRKRSSNGGNGSSASDAPIHVLEIIGNAIVGGMESYVRNLISHLPAERFRVTCLCPYESAFTKQLRQLGCSVFITPLRDDPAWNSIQMAVELVRHRHIDLIHAHLQNAHTLAGIAGQLARRPTVATVHTMSLPAQELSVSRLTDTHLIVVCQAAYAQALAIGIPTERLTLIPNGIDLDTYRPQGGETFRQAIGVAEGAPLVGFVGRLDWEKGPDKFVQMAGRVLEQMPEAHFAIVGEGPMEEEITSMLRRMKLTGQVHMAGLWSKSEQVYPALDVFVQTSRSEAMPLAILEAMACGLPVVAISVGGVAEIVEAGTTGLLLQAGDWSGVASPYPGDWEGVAGALLDLLSRPRRLKEMGRAGRKRVEELFDIGTTVRLTSDLFCRLVNVEGSTAPGCPVAVDQSHFL